MSNGDISQEELVKESQELMSKFKGFEGLSKDGRLKDMMKLFSQFVSKAGDSPGDDGAGTGDFDFEAMMKKMTGGLDLEKMMKPHTEYSGQGVRSGSAPISNSMRDRMKQRIVQKNEQKAKDIAEAQRRMAEAEKNYVPYEFSDDEKEKDAKVFSVVGENKQATSSIKGDGKKDKKKKKK